MAGIRSLHFDKKGKEVLEYGTVVIKSNGVEKELKDDKESYRFLIEKIPAVKDFVLRISGERTNFLAGKPGA
jgi:hypothetical protein